MEKWTWIGRIRWENDRINVSIEWPAKYFHMGFVCLFFVIQNIESINQMVGISKAKQICYAKNRRQMKMRFKHISLLVMVHEDDEETW